MRGRKLLILRLPTPVLAVLLLAWAEAVLAAPGSCFEVARVDPEQILKHLAAQQGNLSAVQGELVQVGMDGGVLETGRVRRVFRFHRDAAIYVNGRPACPAAARPVGPDQFFWAGLWWSRAGEVLVMEAVYCGGEMTVVSASPEALSGSIPETGAVLHLPVAASCRRPPFSPGDAIYVLLDLEGRIRRIWRLE